MMELDTRNTTIFTKENFARLEEIMYEAKVPTGSYLFWEGDLADKMYFIYSGEVKITKSTDEGKSFVLYIFKEGDFLGQLDPYNDAKLSFNAEATEECTVGIIQKKDLEVLLWQHGDLAVEFMKWMGLMYRTTQTKFRDLMLYGKPGALCSTLIRLVNTFGIQHEEGMIIDKKMTNSDLADMIGATRESVNRMLGDLRKADVVDMQHGRILIKDIDYLKDICHCENCPVEICRI